LALLIAKISVALEFDCPRAKLKFIAQLNRDYLKASFLSIDILEAVGGEGPG
jgi:hypothetical protein